VKHTLHHDLRRLVEELVEQMPDIAELYIFGSRAYGTGSLRSDCDILVRASPAARVRSSDLRDFAIEHCPALDLFLCTEARAVSVSNDSFVFAANFETLVARLDAVRLWSRLDGFSDFAFPVSGDWTFEAAANVEFMATSLPDAELADFAWQSRIRTAEAIGLPIRPFLGESLAKATAQVIEVARRMCFSPSDLGQRGGAKVGWTANLQSEYDCQNLFFTVVKPWLPGLAREQTEIWFDGQAKISDFSLFDGRLIIEMKYIDSVGKKAEVVKTLDGLSRFYARNANVGSLVFVIFVKGDVPIDAAQWEVDYSFVTTKPPVTTLVIAIP
jgi:predicted nucleotidyltransferase